MVEGGDGSVKDVKSKKEFDDLVKNFSPFIIHFGRLGVWHPNRWIKSSPTFQLIFLMLTSLGLKQKSNRKYHNIIHFRQFRILYSARLAQIFLSLREP